MPNPFFSNKTSPNGATAPNDSLNESYKRYFRGYNKFNLTRNFYNTERYADINLIEVAEGVEGDKLKFASKHDIRTYTLKAPIMFDLYKKKTYFAVNNLAILPINWKKVYKQPNKGDDVDVRVNCVANILEYVGDLFQNGTLERLSANQNNYNYLWRLLFLFESIFSNGSLLASMNCHLRNTIKVSGKINFDEWLEETLSYFDGFDGRIISVLIPSLSVNNIFTINSQDFEGAVHMKPRELFDLLRTFSDFNIEFLNTDTFVARFNYLRTRLLMLSLNYDFTVIEDHDINLSRLIAYQLVCSQFYTRDSVDNIYTAEDYIDNAKSVILPVVGYSDANTPAVWPQFAYNGTKFDYDVFSGKIINSALRQMSVVSDNTDFDQIFRSYAYLHMIFFFRKSLRYGDYFVGAKTLPYAPMDVTADVVGGGVSALDMTRSIIAQRFANAVERVSNTWNDYLKGVTGGNASPNPYEPRFLASSTSHVGGFEVENTAERQFTNQNITTILKSSNSNYIYEVEVSEPCIVIGVSTYEVPRVYSATVDRFFRHTDRFNMFNKFFQNIGDQEITQNERNAAFSPEDTFGYTPRHMEYKQRYPIASGGFVDNLPGYAFITDNKDSEQNDIDLGSSSKIGSYYLRNRNSEFDRFYSSLTGLSLSYYFHFQVKYTNVLHALRQMEYSPSIL